ncbi:unnamed protein product, partial [Choristocarpus tenellus]
MREPTTSLGKKPVQNRLLDIYLSTSLQKSEVESTPLYLRKTTCDAVPVSSESSQLKVEVDRGLGASTVVSADGQQVNAGQCNKGVLRRKIPGYRKTNSKVGRGQEGADLGFQKGSTSSVIRGVSADQGRVALASLENDVKVKNENFRLKEQLRFQGAVLNQLAADLHSLETQCGGEGASSSVKPVIVEVGAQNSDCVADLGDDGGIRKAPKEYDPLEDQANLARGKVDVAQDEGGTVGKVEENEG